MKQFIESAAAEQGITLNPDLYRMLDGRPAEQVTAYLSLLRKARDKESAEAAAAEPTPERAPESAPEATAEPTPTPNPAAPPEPATAEAAPIAPGLSRTSPSTREAAITGDMSAAINAEIEAISVPKVKPTETAPSEAPTPPTDVGDEIRVARPAAPVEPIGKLDEKEENIIEALDARDQVYGTASPRDLVKIGRAHIEKSKRAWSEFKRRSGACFDEAEARIAKEKRRKDYIARGLPADLDELDEVEQRRILKAKEMRDYRDRKRGKAAAVKPAPAPPTFTAEWRNARMAELNRWLDALPIDRSRQLRRDREKIIGYLIAYRIAQHHKPGRKVTDRALAEQLGIEGNGYRQGKCLKTLSAEIGGAWALSPRRNCGARG